LSTKSALESISEGSCDTEDWSNDAENQLYHHRNKLQFKIIILTCKKYFTILQYLLYFIKWMQSWWP